MYRNTPVRGLQTQQRRPRCGKEDSNVTVVIRVDQPPVVSFFFRDRGGELDGDSPGHIYRCKDYRCNR